MTEPLQGETLAPHILVSHLPGPGHLESHHALNPGKKKKQMISEWKQIRGSPESSHLLVWAQPFLIPRSTVTLSYAWILLSVTSWILFWTTDQAFQRKDTGSQYSFTPRLFWGRSTPENSREPCWKKGPMLIPISTTLKNRSPSKPRVSVNELGIIFGFYATQSCFGP